MRRNWYILLASQSPRRAQLLDKMGLKYTVVSSSVQEIIPANTPLHDIPEILARQKASGVSRLLKENEILLTADTLVFCENRIMGKPGDIEEAKEMLRFLSGKVHTVISGVYVKSLDKEKSFHASTEIEFHSISNPEIAYYANNYKVLDKAGAYAIQDWIGTVAVKTIKGEYNNVVGLPTAKLYHVLKTF